MTDNEEFQPQRLTLARRRRALTKTDLAALCDVSARSITAYEAGESVPTAGTLATLARALDFPPGFFSCGPPPILEPENASFRALSRMTAGQRACVLAAGELAIELDAWIDREFERPTPNLPDLRGADPETAAEALRGEWGLGYRPLPNLIHLLEAHGVRVYSLAFKSREVDAFSIWWDNKPFVFLNTMKSAERSRFDAAHELGHLVIHRHGQPNGREVEEAADRFASSFLMPRADVLAHLPRRATLPAIISGKKRWGVSALAFTYRLHALDALTDWNYRQLCIRLKSQYKASEPEGRPRETSQALAKVFSSLRGEGVSRRELARDLGVFVRDIDELVFGLVLTSTPGGSPNSPSPEARGTDGVSHLRVV